ncbi:MAG: ABC transporter permease [Chloroflexi bacterium]|jgi:peptide/nickel transport system permease protein|nr:ABC transporter permease [Chloroflexota bacterium]MBT4002102.1 ABC transporter permease [Chloroflexota bacterium]MBT4305663.1 ABC transporter permease [Chloroflexota bacterium]MBT4533487.1 ABC transporter permease [Chloroflexota bacterium]MBT4681870.1 ABC transporter permease [Chloroflexota bacterium]
MTFGYVFKKLIKNPIAFIGLLLLLGFIIMAVWAPVFAPVPENARDPYMIPRDGFSAVPVPPNEDHILGTTEGQYDIFYGIIWGSRTAFRIGVVITLFTTLMGIMVGSVAAYYGGWIDEVLMRITEIFQTFPFLLTAITLTSVLQAVYGRGEAGALIYSAKILAFLTFGHSLAEKINPIQLTILTGMISIIMFGWMTIARVTRGNILTVKNYEYAIAAETIGAKNLRILFRHLMPNAIFPVLVIASMNIGSYVLTFAALSFLGLGAQRGYADWGQMISFARNWIPSLAEYSHIVIYPGMAILLFVLAWNLVGDALRDILDPRMRGTK